MADFQRFWEDWICRMNTIRPFFVLCGTCVCHMGAETACSHAVWHVFVRIGVESPVSALYGTEA